MFFLPAESPIFVTDNTIEELFTTENSIKKKLINYQLNREDEHKKIYLPPSIFELFKKSYKGEVKAQIENLFTSVSSAETKNIFQETCLTGEWLKNIAIGSNILFITNNKKFHTDKFKSILKEYGFSDVWSFEKLALL